MEQKMGLCELAKFDHYLDSIRDDISPGEYDHKKAAIKDAFAEELADTLPLSLLFLKGPKRKYYLGLLKKYPQDMNHHIDLWAILLKKDLSFDPKLEAFFDPKKILKKADGLRKKDQSIRSKGKPKNRRAPTAKTVTVPAMRKARKDGQTLTQFLASAEAGGRLEITPENLRGVPRYAIEAEELSKTARVAHSTLEEWFTEAGKQAAPD